MKKVKLISLLTIAAFMVSCNEKISPELQDSNSSTPGTGNPVAPSEYYFKVTNTSPVLSNYHLHKSGPGNKNTPCEIKNTTGLSSDIFRGNQAANDITCFFEAEELSLFHQGMQFEIGASANTCDFVAYSPFSFYDQIPGDSSGSFTQVDCGNETTTAAHVATALGGIVEYGAGPSTLGCGEWATNDIVDADRVPFSANDDESLCRFNYQNAKCDVGIITVNKYTVNYTPATADAPAELASELETRQVFCGGLVSNCVKGAIEELDADTLGATRKIVIAQAEVNTPYVQEETFAPLIGKHSSTKKYANYRRNLASNFINYGTSFGLTPAYKNSFNDPLYSTTVSPNLLENYSANRMMDGNPLVTQAMLDAHSYPNNMYRAVPLAAEPFIGLGGATVNPFYTFYCLDTAFDIKARIRMMVRDWDRVFPTNTDSELLSDIFRNANSRQDNPTGVEIENDLDILMPFNDMKDWDDKVEMERTLGPYDPFTTVWRPVPTAIYLEGFFNPSYFTNENY